MDDCIVKLLKFVVRSRDVAVRSTCEVRQVRLYSAYTHSSCSTTRMISNIHPFQSNTTHLGIKLDQNVPSIPIHARNPDPEVRLILLILRSIRACSNVRRDQPWFRLPIYLWLLSVQPSRTVIHIRISTSSRVQACIHGRVQTSIGICSAKSFRGLWPGRIPWRRRPWHVRHRCVRSARRRWPWRRGLFAKRRAQGVKHRREVQELGKVDCMITRGEEMEAKEKRGDGPLAKGVVPAIAVLALKSPHATSAPTTTCAQPVLTETAQGCGLPSFR